MDVAKNNDVFGRLVEKLRVMVDQQIRKSHVVSRRQAVVVAVNAGPPATVDLKIGASATTVAGVRYLSSYTPAVGHTVWVDIQDEDPIVIGRLA